MECDEEKSEAKSEECNDYSISLCMYTGSNWESHELSLHEVNPGLVQRLKYHQFYTFFLLTNICLFSCVTFQAAIAG